MGTSNFGKKNASSYFVISDEGWEDLWEERIEMLRDQFMEQGFESCSKDWLHNEDARCIAVISESRMYGDVPVQVDITVVLRPGYYTGACFDWLPYFHVGYSDGDEVPEVLEVFEDFESYSGMNPGLIKIQSWKAFDWLEKTFDSLVEKTESIMKEVCDTNLRRVATFSNGETIYEEV